MKQYLDGIKYIMENGTLYPNRTGTDAIGVFGYSMRFDLADGFPAVTTKKLAWKAVVGELLWFLEGSTDERRLAEITFEDKRENLVGRNTIWTANADNQGKALGYLNNQIYKGLGNVYGHQWRNFNGVDQIQKVIYEIKNNPDSRRIIFSAWNPVDIPNMALPPCHIMAHFRVIDNKLSCLMYQRSADFGLGVPFNIASYALLTHIVAQICGLEVGEFIHNFGDVHIYVNHTEALQEQVARIPQKLPRLVMPEVRSLGDVILGTKVSDYILEGYNPMDSIKMEMAV